MPSWALEASRTQGGGWIWFPGKAKANTEQRADVLAKGAALDYLIQECQIPHLDVKFHERFVIEESGSFRVFVRASIKQEQCNAGKYGTTESRSKLVSEPLLQLYRQYRVKVAEQEVATKLCKVDPYRCSMQGLKSVNSGNWYQALAYYQSACEHGFMRACKYSRVVTKYLKDNHR